MGYMPFLRLETIMNVCTHARTTIEVNSFRVDDYFNGRAHSLVFKVIPKWLALVLSIVRRKFARAHIHLCIRQTAECLINEY